MQFAKRSKILALTVLAGVLSGCVSEGGLDLGLGKLIFLGPLALPLSLLGANRLVFIGAALVLETQETVQGAPDTFPTSLVSESSFASVDR